LSIFSTKPVLVVRVIWGGIIDGSMELADVSNLAVSKKKGKEIFTVKHAAFHR
jgi:hypothetical protein